MSRPRKKPKPAPPKAPKAVPPARRERRPLRPFFAAVGTLAVAVAVLLGLGQLGNEARLRVGERGRYEYKFADVDAPAPPGVDRSRFLAEVRAAGGSPETFQLLDADQPAKLRAAFAAHPWVAAVDAVAVEPPSQVRVRLTFRTPALAVRTEGRPAVVRLVDASGVLLPASATPADLPELLNRVPRPRTPDGRVWADPVVARAVELVRAYRPRTLEKTLLGWRLVQPDGAKLFVGG